VSFINEHRERFGVEPICDTLQVAPSTYYAALSRPASARQLRDRELKVVIARVHQENFDVYGTEKVWKQLRREDIEVGRDRVGRLMAELELEGAVRGKTWRTTIPSALAARPADLVDRDFSATAPNRLWVADLTYVSTWPGAVYTAFVTDVFSRYVVGWKVSTSAPGGRDRGGHDRNRVARARLDRRGRRRRRGRGRGQAHAPPCGCHSPPPPIIARAGLPRENLAYG